MVAISAVVEKEMGGTSGGLYAILLSGLSKGLLEAARDQGAKEATREVWARGLEVCPCTGFLSLFTVPHADPSVHSLDLSSRSTRSPGSSRRARPSSPRSSQHSTAPRSSSRRSSALPVPLEASNFADAPLRAALLEVEVRRHRHGEALGRDGAGARDVPPIPREGFLHTSSNSSLGVCSPQLLPYWGMQSE